MSAGTDLALVESASLRAAYADRTDALAKVKPFTMLPGNEYATTDMLAADFEVSADTIRQLAARNAEELASNGRLVVTTAEARKIAGQGQSDNMSLTLRGGRGDTLALWPPRAVLNVAMLLRDSEVARKVRYLILDNAFNPPRPKSIQVNPLEVLQATLDRPDVASVTFYPNRIRVNKKRDTSATHADPWTGSAIEQEQTRFLEDRGRGPFFWDSPESHVEGEIIVGRLGKFPSHKWRIVSAWDAKNVFRPGLVCYKVELADAT